MQYSLPVWRAAAARLGLQSLTGMLVWAATPGLGGRALLAGVAFVPLLLSLRALHGWAAFGWGLLGGLIYIIPGKWTTVANAAAANRHAGIPDDILVLGFFLSYAAPFAAFAVLGGVLRHRFTWQHASSRMLLPWLAGFGLAGLIVITPVMFPFTPVVLISDVSDLIQLADIGGEPLLLGLLMTVNVGVATALHHRKALLAPAAIAILLPVGLALSYAHWGASVQRANGAAATNAQSSVSAIGLQSRWPVGSGNRILLRDKRGGGPKSAVELTRVALEQNPGCNLVIWPEIPALHEHDLSCETAKKLALETNSTILTSCHERDDGKHILPARLYTPAGAAAEHRKSRLIPGFERSLWNGEAAIHPGRGPTLMKTGDIPPFAPSICYEIHFRHDLRRMANAGALWFVQMANFNLFRSSLSSEWDLAITRLRAVENRRSILRSLNAGRAGLVLPNGEWQSALPSESIGAECHRVPIRNTRTFYSRWGDRTFWILLLVLAGASWGLNRRFDR